MTRKTYENTFEKKMHKLQPKNYKKCSCKKIVISDLKHKRFVKNNFNKFDDVTIIVNITKFINLLMCMLIIKLC